MATINADVYKKLLAQYWSAQAVANAVMNKYWPNSPEYQAINDYIWNAWDNIQTSGVTNNSWDFPSWLNSNINPNNSYTQPEITSWYSDNWQIWWDWKFIKKPRITVNWVTKEYNTLSEAIAAMNDIKNKWWTWPVDQYIQEFQAQLPIEAKNKSSQPNNTKKTELETKIKSGNFSAAEAYEYNKLMWDNEAARKLALTSKDAINNLTTTLTDAERKIVADTLWVDISQVDSKLNKKTLSDIQKETTPFVEGVDQGKITEYQTEFDKSWNKFIEESKNVYWLETAQQLEKYRREWMDIETAQNKLNTQYGWQEQDLSTKYSQSLTQYDWQTQNLNTQLARNQADYATYTSQNQQDFNYNIASQNKDYSKALSSASNAYWQRGILKSGIAKQQTQEATQEFSNEQAYFKTMNQRKLDEASLSLWRTTEDINKNLWQLGTQKGWTTQEYNTNQARLWTQKGWSATDYATQTGRLAQDKATLEKSRQAGADVLWINLQAQWDVVYNQWIQQYYQLLQAQKEQEAINKLYWTTTTATKIPYRVWGKYTL
jgi:hypothetical protein